MHKMDRGNHSDPARTNMNQNNNTEDRTKPNVPCKPHHLTGIRNPSAPLPFSKNIVTPKGWNRQAKFTFNQTDRKNSDSAVRDSSGVSEARHGPKWRPVPKVMQKQGSLKDSSGIAPPWKNEGATVKNVIKEMEEKSGNHDRQLKTGKLFLPVSNDMDKDIQRSFGSIKRVWDERSKSPTIHPNNKYRDWDPSKKSEIESCDKSSAAEEDVSASNAIINRSTSSSSDGSVRTASFKNNKATYHYVTVNPTANFPADALPSKIEFKESQPLPSPTKKFDHKILAPRPFQSSFDESGTMQRPVLSNPKEPNSSKGKRVSVKYPRKPRHSRKQESSSDSNSKSDSGEDSDEVEMRMARKKGTLVTRFDSRGNKYKVNPRTGEVIYMVDDAAMKKENEKSSRGVFQRMDAVSTEGTSMTESNSDSKERKSSESSQENPPPLLPREKNKQRQDSSVVPPSRGKMTKSVTTKPMYSGKSSYSPPSPAYFSGGLSPKTSVPPPLLPRGQPTDNTNTLDYTPMSGASCDIPIHDKGSVGSSVSLNSYLDQATYEPMNQRNDSWADSFADEDDALIYSAAINPPPRNPRRSIREYHEITPDMEEETGPSTADAPPPPPEHDPPSLRGNSMIDSPQVSRDRLESPPPLPPMNQRKLNYIDVEFKSSVSREHRISSAKTNYSEVVVGSSPRKEETDTKKGKSVKEKILAMISSGKAPDGYSSEGDPSHKHGDERTTDFSKERNKIKRISGRILRKKKQKSKQDIHDSKESEVSQSEHGRENINVGVYGSVTNLSSTSSESSRSLSQMVQNNIGGVGDSRAWLSSQIRGPNTDRRQSYEPGITQLPPKLGEKSRSEVHLPSPMSVMNSSDQIHSVVPPLSAENTPKHSNKDRKNSSKDASRSPAISAPRVESHLHQKLKKTDGLQTPSRRVSEPPPTEYMAMDGNDNSKRSSYHPEIVMTPPKTLAMHQPDFNDPDNYEFADNMLSPSLPTEAPPPPPVDSVHLRHSQSPPVAPPDPMRSSKPDRFKKRPKSHEASYVAAKETSVMVDGGHDPIYDVATADPDVTPGMDVPVSPAAKSKLLESEPLYQVYRSRTLSHASMKVRRNQSNKQKISAKKKDSSSSDQGDDEWQSDLMTEDAGATTLWKEVKEVVESGIGGDLTREEMKLQQAQFEVVTSQASYMRSLNILIGHFMNDPIMKDTSLLPKQQKKELFSNIVDVRKIEQSFLQEIEQHFWSKLYLTEIAKITARYAKADFEVYVRYVQNQVYQDRVLTDLQRHNDRFAGELSRLESSPSCNKLPLLSFLLLPMQRVTRLPLLISAIVNQADAARDYDAYKEAKEALVVVNKLVKRCNEGARKMQQTEQLAEIAKDLKFASNVKTYALVSQSRALVKKGEMSATMIVEGRKPKAIKLWLFLFTDVLLLAKKKTFLDSVTGARYEVIDWAKRAMLFVNERAVSENEIFLVLLENSSSKRVELTLTPLSLNELSRWTDALNPQHAAESEDSIYESWDCPQYQCMEPYNALQPDELALEVGDIMRVLKKTGDGWLEGERLRDSESGWFPADKCYEIKDEHVRARNLKNLYRITAQGSDLTL